jgi:chromosome segregation ATPase
MKKEILLYVLYAVLIGFGVFFVYKGLERKTAGDYLTYIKTSSEAISQKLDDQSTGINDIANFGTLTEEDIDGLESSYTESKGLITEKRSEVVNYTEVSKNIAENFEAFLEESDNANEKYLELINSIKDLESSEEIKNKIKDYNDQIIKVEKQFDQLAKELNIAVDAKLSVKIV